MRETNLRFADDDHLETVHEFVHEFSWKENLLTPHNYRLQGRNLGRVTEEHRRAWTRSAANARRRALDLVNGLGVVGDPEGEDRQQQHWSLPKAAPQMTTGVNL